VNNQLILHLSTQDFGGAGIAATRIHECMLKSGLDSVFLTRFSSFESNKKHALEARPTKYDFSKIVKVIKRKLNYREKYNMFSISDRSSYNIIKEIQALALKPDIVIFHWIADFISLEDMQAIKNRFDCKVYWYAMDMALLTGGCHFSWDCQEYKSGCVKCPAEYLHRGSAAKYFQKKCNVVARLGIESIASNEWVKKQIQSSAIPFRATHLAYLPIDIDVFKPFLRNKEESDKTQIRILFGAVNTKDKRKGLEYFLKALFKLKVLIQHSTEQLLDPVVILPGPYTTHIDSIIPFKIERLDFANSDLELNMMYQSSDVYVSASIEDTGPMMVSESLMSGIPVIAFNMGVCSELISNGINGYIVHNKDSDALAHKLFDFIAKSIDEIKEMKVQARSSVIDKISVEAHVKQIKRALGIS